MRLKAPIPPLVFSFCSLDNLLDGISISRPYGSDMLIYRLGRRYYLLLTVPISRRIRARIHLCEYGTFIGSGILYRAFLEEHGAQLLNSPKTC